MVLDGTYFSIPHSYNFSRPILKALHRLYPGESQLNLALKLKISTAKIQSKVGFFHVMFCYFQVLAAWL